MQEVPPLNEIDEHQFAQLTEQESFTEGGEIKKLALIESMINDRTRERKNAKRSLLRVAGHSEQEVNRQLDEMQPLRFIHFPVAGNRYNLIVQKGDDDASFKVMMPAHVDTVAPSTHSKNMLQLKKNEEKQQWEGLGVYDMGGAILNNIALAVDTNVPKGMKVFFVFSIDEEGNSIGAKELVQSWEEWKDIDVVLSSEIGPYIREQQEDDTAMRYLLGRRGRLKMLGSINIPKDAQGHGSIPDLPNASDALIEYGTKIWKRFHRTRVQEGQPISPLAQKHPLLGAERYYMGRIMTDDPSDFVSTNTATFKCYADLVPPSTAHEKLGMIVEAGRHIAEMSRWSQYQIQHTLIRNPEATSYDPYCMPRDHALVNVVHATLQDVSGTPPIPEGALSVGDENLYAAALLDHADVPSFEQTPKGVISIPILGGHAHHPDEWVSIQDIARVRLAMRTLIEKNMDALRNPS